ncbi:ribonuclease [Sphingomonas sp. FW199]|uniref:ribonuclease n=1 Tax=Sphingomonas sp. FW199 TaxID=3400217 RepID=UPI003CEFDEBA
MADWWVERGIGETRAILIGGDRILEARIEPDGGLTAGTVLDARLVRRITARNQGIVELADGQALVSPLPPGITQGAMCRIEITRPATPEPGKPKRARARPAAHDAVIGPAPALADRLPGARVPPRFGPDPFEQAGWSEVLEEAETGLIRFAGGSLSIHPTPAMTLFDADGELAPLDLGMAAARAAGAAIRRLDIAGSIGIDLPTVEDKAARIAMAEALDQSVPPPFERTAVNGFGFVQIVRRRERLSLPELYALDPAAWAARALIRRAERSIGHGERLIAAHPDVVAAIAANPGWTDRLAARLGAPVTLQPDPALRISGGHVQPRHA